jgi:hypothetical protein
MWRTCSFSELLASKTLSCKHHDQLANQRACLFRKWLKMVFIPFLGFGGGFEAYLLLTFTSMLWSSNRARCSLNVSWESPASRRICRSFHDLPSLKTADLPIKQAQIEPEKAKEELRPI